MLKQKECVFLSVLVLLKSMNTKFVEFETIVKDLAGFDKKKLNALVIEQFKSKKVTLDQEFENEEARLKYINEYVPGLVSNHLRRDRRINGNVKDVPKNPGSMTGNKDPKIKNLRAVIRQLEADNKPAAIIKQFQDRLTTMVNEYKVKNGKSIEIDVNQLDPEMKKLYESTINKAA